MTRTRFLDQITKTTVTKKKEQGNNESTRQQTNANKQRRKRRQQGTMNLNQTLPLASSGNDLDDLLLDIVTNSNFTQHDMGALMTFCRKHLPTRHNDLSSQNHDEEYWPNPRIAFIEGVCLIAAYVKMGFIDLHNANHIEHFQFSEIHYETNACGRITMLHIEAQVMPVVLSGDEAYEDFGPWYLSKDILRLQQLEDLTITGVDDINDDCDLSALPHLKKLTLESDHILEGNDDWSSRTVPSRMKLPQLEELVVYGSHDRRLPRPNLVTWMTQQLPNLKHLELRMNFDSGATEPFLDALIHTNTFCFQESLESISLMGCQLEKKNRLQTIIKSVLPRFVRLGSIAIADKRIQSFEFPSTVTAMFPLPSKIHTFLVSTVRPRSVHAVAMDDSKAREDMLNFVDTNNSVYNLMCVYDRSTEYHSDIKYKLLINHAGRSLIENRGSENSLIVPSLLPTLLARSYQHSVDIYPTCSPFYGTKDPTGIYYLLQNNIPALMDSSDVTMDN